jgi:hypothetical protein
MHRKIDSKGWLYTTSGTKTHMKAVELSNGFILKYSKARKMNWYSGTLVNKYGATHYVGHAASLALLIEKAALESDKFRRGV